MNSPVRATQAEDKEARKAGLLDAAQSLLLEHPARLPSVDEVAARAGVSKGTVYLYFAAKEDLLLGAHERNKDAFFRALIARVEDPAPMTIDTMLALTRSHIIDVPAFLPLAAIALGMLDKAMTPAAVDQFQARMAEQIGRAGAGLERHFGLPVGEGVRLLGHSYGLIVGLWQLAAVEAPVHAVCPLTREIYPAEVERALRDLWAGRIASIAATRHAPR